MMTVTVYDQDTFTDDTIGSATVDLTHYMADTQEQKGKQPDKHRLYLFDMQGQVSRENLHGISLPEGQRRSQPLLRMVE